MCPVLKTIALGGVATGNIKAQLAAIAAGMAIISTEKPWDTATAARSGRKAAAVAVLEVTSVRKIMTSATSAIIPSSGKVPSDPMLFAIHSASPVD